MKRLMIAAIILIAAVALVIYSVAHKAIYGPVTAFRQDVKALYILQPTPLPALVDQLALDSIISDSNAFKRIAGLKKFHTALPGRYLIAKNTSANELINRLRSGWQDPVKVTFNSMRTEAELAGHVAQQLALDSTHLLNRIQDSATAAHYGFTREQFKCMFIPNTYELWWTTDEQGFIERMAQEFKRFWTEERKARATQLGLSQSEVYTLASIVQAETSKKDEAPIVAGLYLNRLRIRMPLQADPTLIYAHNDFTIRRVLNVHKEIDSPYNTYKYAGLPPGPINFPDVIFIDAVLNPSQHEYLYMCAKADLSGYHHFAKTLNQHLQYAREYQRAISARR
jgi:UPF0755 protein